MHVNNIFAACFIFVFFLVCTPNAFSTPSASDRLRMHCQANIDSDPVCQTLCNSRGLGWCLTGTPKDRGGIMVADYDPWGKTEEGENPHAVVWEGPGQKKIIAFRLPFQSGAVLPDGSKVFINGILMTEFLKGELSKLRSIKVIGHTDLMRIGSECKGYDGPGNDCRDKGISDPCSNACLGYMRALELKKLVEMFISRHMSGISCPQPNITASYEPDFFMSPTNDKLDKLLWKALNVELKVKKIKEVLGISTPYNAEDIRLAIKDVPGRPVHPIYKPILKHKVHYEGEFAPFRSVVVITQFSQESRCQNNLQ